MRERNKRCVFEWAKKADELRRVGGVENKIKLYNTEKKSGKTKTIVSTRKLSILANNFNWSIENQCKNSSFNTLELILPWRYLYIHVHCCSSHSSKRMQSAQMSINK